MKTFSGILAAILALVATTPAYSQSNESETAINVTANDFVTKVYGLFSPQISKGELCDNCRAMLKINPEEEGANLWLDTAEEYRLNYYGQELHCVSAMATIEGDSVANFGYFVIFPYNYTNKQETTASQAQFCGCLLQELHDLGAELDVATIPGSLFEVTGSYSANHIDLRLTDEPADIFSGRFVLYITVEPNASLPVPADSFAAL